MRERQSSPVGIGIMAILTVLLVLVLAIFSCLTLSTAQADYVLAQRAADAVQNFYEADGKARQLYAAFLDGREEELDLIVPLDEMQGIHIHLQRVDGEAVTVLAWQTVLMEDFTKYADRPLPIWTGEEE